jgi:hypothetical protein
MSLVSSSFKGRFVEGIDLVELFGSSGAPEGLVAYVFQLSVARRIELLFCRPIPAGAAFNPQLAVAV